MVISLMGVSGAGKTTIGQLLAHDLGWEFHDGDATHSASNREKMRAGIALTDQDRAPWLAAIRRLIEDCLAQHRNAVIACSALKRRYQSMLIVDPARVKLVWLDGSPDVIGPRIAARRHHFMPITLLTSQFQDLEPPRDALRIDVASTPAEIVAQIRHGLAL